MDKLVIPPFRQRYRPPWRVEETPGGFRVCDCEGRTLAWLYVREDLQHWANSDYLTRGEALALARKIAALGEQ